MGLGDFAEGLGDLWTDYHGLRVTLMPGSHPGFPVMMSSRPPVGLKGLKGFPLT